MIAEFYKDCEIFITGGSGVVGKAAIEKLLRSCDVRKIYILLRSKNGKNVEPRLEKIKNSKIFRVLKTEKPNELDKLVAIPGDAFQPNLGITPEYAKLMENVSIVFHCAATVRFNEVLKIAITLNVGGTWEALKFAETLKNLKIFMHVSTFFSNPYLKRVEPKLYDSPINWKLFLDLVQDDSKQDLLDALTKKVITGFPNTYCFTKNLAESAVNDFRKRRNMPVAIYRPSIVLFALREPEPGFPPSLMGAMGLFVSVGAGIIKSVYMQDDIHLDITPLDLGTIVMLANAMIAAKAYQAGPVVDIPVSICSSRGITPFTFKQTTCLTNDLWAEIPFDKNFLIPWGYYTNCRFLYKLLCFTHQIIPSMIGDGLLMLFGQEPVLMGVVRKGYISLEIMKPFLFNNYQCEGITKLENLCEITKGTAFAVNDMREDPKHLPGMTKIVRNMLHKIREVLLNEDAATMERAKKVLRVKYIVFNVLRALLAYYLIRWFYRIIFSYFNEI